MPLIVLFSLIIFTTVSPFVLILKNKLLVTPTPNLSVCKFFYYINFIILFTPFFLTEVYSDKTVFGFFVLNWLLAIIIPLFVPIRSIELIKACTGVIKVIPMAVVRFRPGFGKVQKMWWARYIVVFLSIIFYVIIK